jgi:uncharacterized membrane protein
VEFLLLIAGLIGLFYLPFMFVRTIVQSIKEQIDKDKQ